MRPAARFREWTGRMNWLLAASGAVVAATLAPLVLALALYAWSLASRPRGSRAGGRAAGPVEFVIVSRADSRTLQSLLDVVSETRRRYPGRRIWIVVDHDSEGLDVLRGMAGEAGFRLVVVPEGYGRGRHKARAIQYFIDCCVDEDKWYVFLDDDSYPLDPGIEEHLDPEIPVYNGVIVARPGRSLVSWVADSTRYVHSLTRNRAALARLHKPLYGLHGELLVARGSVLRSVEFATDSIVEDTHYAARLMRAGIPVGLVPVRVSILSPNSVLDLWRQRSRWNLGVLRDIARGRYPLLLALHRGADALAWLASPLAPAAWIMLLGHAAASSPAVFHGLALLGSSLIAASVAGHLVLPAVTGPGALARAILAAPLAALAQLLSPLYALVAGVVEARRFTVIDKNVVVAGDAVASPLGDPSLNPPGPATGSPVSSPYRGLLA